MNEKLIDILKNISIRIKYKDQVIATGTLVKDVENVFYLLTAAHVVYGKKHDEEKDIKEFRFDLNNESITLDVDSVITVNNEDNIFDIIAIKLNNKPKKYINIKIIKDFLPESLNFRSYPQIEQNGINFHDYILNDFDNSKINFKVKGPFEDFNHLNYGSGSDYDGCSGSGLIYFRDSEPYLLGIYKGFSITNNGSFCILDCIKLSALDDKIKFDYEIIQPYKGSIQKDIITLSHYSNEILENIKNSIGTINLAREKISNQLKEFIDKNSTIIVTGDAGSGKSAIIKNILLGQENYNNIVMAFKADFFGKETLVESSNNLGLKNPIIEIITQIALIQRVIIFIDSFEKLLDVKNRIGIEIFIKKIESLDSVKLIITCRTFALSQLKNEFYYFFPKPNQELIIPYLESEDIEIIKKKYNKVIFSIPKKYRTKILKNPFYLDLVIKHYQNEKPKAKIKNFYFLIWNKIILKNNPLRGKCFMNIAIMRAKSMKMFTSIKECSVDVLKELLLDNIIIQSDEDNSLYAPAHDIFEDFGIIKYIDEKYEEFNSNYSNLIKNIDGKNPAIRRAYRLWLDKELESIQYDIKIFINNLLNDSLLDRFWYDETITAILKSDYLSSFLNDCKKNFLENDGKLFLRFLKMLLITCQIPDDYLFQNILHVYNHKNTYDYFFIIPDSESWEKLFIFFSENKEALTSHFFYVIELIVEYWIKKIDNKYVLSSTEKIIATILLEFIQNYKDFKLKYESLSWNDVEKENLRESIYHDNKAERLFQKSVVAVFRLTEIIQEDVKKLIDEALIVSQDKRRHSYSEFILEKVLSFYDSEQVCKFLPELVINVANNVWKMENSDDEDYYWAKELEYSFGLNDVFRTFPASPFKTPLFFLLKHHPWDALNFIVDFLNFSIHKYIKSGYEDKHEETRKGNQFLSLLNNNGEDIPIQIEITLNDGKKVKQYGSPLLWCMYRGTYRATPYLLQSLLMSLEKYLLNIAEMNKDWVYGYLTKVFNFLLENSNSVAILSVLTSVALAYPELVGENILPLFTVKNFFFWDIVRFLHEHSALSPMDLKDPYIQKERYESNILHHREKDLEYLIKNMQLGQFRSKILIILDDHKKNLKNDDLTWKNILTRIDSRNWSLGKKQIIENKDGSKKSYIPIEVKQDEDVIGNQKKYLEESKDHHRTIEIIAWSRNILDEKEVNEGSYTKWNEYYNFVTRDRKEDKPSNYFDDFSGLAVVGIKKYYLSLTPTQKEYCINLILVTLRQQIILPWDRHYPQSSSHLVYCINVLPDLFISKYEDIQNNIIVLLFLLLDGISITGLNEDDHILRAIEIIAKINPKIINILFNGFFELYNFRKKYFNFNYRNIEEQEVKESFNLLIENILSNSKNIKIENVPFDNISKFIFQRAIKLVSIMVNETNSNQLFLTILTKAFNCDDKIDRIFDFQISWKKSYVDFLFKLPKDMAKKYFVEFVDYIFNMYNNSKRFDNRFIKDIFESIIIKVNKKNDLSEVFWELWNILYEKIIIQKEIYIVKVLIPSLFLNKKIGWDSDEIKWAPLTNCQKSFFKNILNEFSNEYLKDAVSLLAGIGFEVLLPDGISWIKEKLNNKVDALEKINNNDILSVFEKLILRTYHLKRDDLRGSRILKEEMVYILDLLIEAGSPISYIIRDRILSLQVFDSI